MSHQAPQIGFDRHLELHWLDAVASWAAASLSPCLLYTSDAADERSSVDLGGRRIIKKKQNTHIAPHAGIQEQQYMTTLYDKLQDNRK